MTAFQKEDALIDSAWVEERNSFVHRFNVSRETLHKLDRYALLLDQGQKRMNLVGSSTLPHLWHRHFFDSAQLLACFPPDQSGSMTWLDIGTGAGFPGLVLAILGVEKVHLVESTGKKVTFLQSVVEDLTLEKQVTIHHQRVEDLEDGLAFDAITARACAPLKKLFSWAEKHTHAGTVWILPKGENTDEELTDARKYFYFSMRQVPSETNPQSRILIVKKVKGK